MRPIVQGRCVSCHQLGGIAPFPLTTYPAVKAHRWEMAYVVQHRIMPPWHAKHGRQQYLFDPTLSRAQIATLVRWATQGGVRGDPRSRRPPLKRKEQHLSRVDVTVKMPAPYTPTPPDEYRCFVLDWTPDHPTYVTGFQAVPGRPSIVHHSMLFIAYPGDVPRVEAWDARDPGPGYHCFSGPVGDAGAFIFTYWLGIWAPGTNSGDLPAGTGLPLVPGMRLILQMHYNAQDVTRAKPDQTRIRLKLDDHVDKASDVGTVFNPLWLKGRPYFVIPAGKKVTFQYSMDPHNFLAYHNAQHLTIYSVMLHMHRLGTRGSLTLVRAGGSRSVLLSVPHWDFRWQGQYYLAHPVTLGEGDRLVVRCSYDNSAAHQPVVGGGQQRPHDVVWGDYSSDEMCNTPFYYTWD